MGLTIAICEDEDIQRKLLRLYLSKVFEEETYRVLEYRSGEELISNYPLGVDILLLDVQMSAINGLDSAREIRKIDSNVSIIFVTSFMNFMHQGYEVRAFRYLLKPVKYEDFSKHLIECRKDINLNQKNYLTIKDIITGEIIRIYVNSILYIETDCRYISIHTDNNVYKSRENLSNLEKKLGVANFFRCHRSYLININKVNSIKKDTVVIKGTEILVSRYKAKSLKLILTRELGNLIC